MENEFNAKLCDERHEEITRKFDTLFKKFDVLSFMVALFTIVGIAVSIIQAMGK